MPRHIHVHLHDDFEEALHPRGHGGKFAAKAGGVAQRGMTQIGHLAQRGGEALAHEDYHVLREQFAKMSDERKSLSEKIKTIAGTLPALLKTHLREERDHAIHAGHALRALSHGQKPSSEEMKGLRHIGMAVMLSAASMMTHGDPTGSLGHVLAALSGEIVDHTILEHGAKLGAGVGMAAYHHLPWKRMWAHDADNDEALLRAFIEQLAKAVAAYKGKPSK